MAVWQVQQARANLSEVLRRAHDGGEQIITRNGREVAVVADIETYRTRRSDARTLADVAATWPKLDDDTIDELNSDIRDWRSTISHRTPPEFLFEDFEPSGVDVLDPFAWPT